MHVAARIEMPELINKLDASLRECDPVESKRFLKEFEAIVAPKGFSAKVRLLEHQIAGYEFDSARNSLTSLADELMGSSLK
jgi:hypothetical protein